jgi:hypothetical protein
MNENIKIAKVAKGFIKHQSKVFFDAKMHTGEPAIGSTCRDGPVWWTAESFYQKINKIGAGC